MANDQSTAASLFNPSLGTLSCFPPEIRKIIFTFAIDDPHDEVDTQGDCDPPQLYLVSRQIHEETIEMTQRVMREPCQHHNFFYHLPVGDAHPLRLVDIFPQYPAWGWRGHSYKFVENKVRFIRQYAADERPAVTNMAGATVTLGWPWGSTMEIQGGTPYARAKLEDGLRHELEPDQLGLLGTHINLRLWNERHLVEVARLLCRNIANRIYGHLSDDPTDMELWYSEMADIALLPEW